MPFCRWPCPIYERGVFWFRIIRQKKCMRTLFSASKGSMYPAVKTGGFIAPSNYPLSLNAVHLAGSWLNQRRNSCEGATSLGQRSIFASCFERRPEPLNEDAAAVGARGGLVCTFERYGHWLRPRKQVQHPCRRCRDHALA